MNNHMSLPTNLTLAEAEKRLTNIEVRLDNIEDEINELQEERDGLETEYDELLDWKENEEYRLDAGYLIPHIQELYNRSSEFKLSGKAIELCERFLNDEPLSCIAKRDLKLYLRNNLGVL